MKAQQEYENYKKWCQENKKPIRSYNAFCQLREYFKQMHLHHLLWNR